MHRTPTWLKHNELAQRGCLGGRERDCTGRRFWQLDVHILFHGSEPQKQAISHWWCFITCSQPQEESDFWHKSFFRNEEKEKFCLFLAISHLAAWLHRTLQLQCHKICGTVPRGRPSSFCFSACFVPECHKAKLKVPRTFSQLLWMQDYHTFHGNGTFACANDSQEIFICIETCWICTSNCNNCMWKGRCKAIHTLTLFIHNWICTPSRAERISPTSPALSWHNYCPWPPEQQMRSESFCLPTLKEQEPAWTLLSLGGKSKMRHISLPFLRLRSPDVIKSLWELLVRTAGPGPLFVLLFKSFPF